MEGRPNRLVLVVDDDSDARGLLETLLRIDGYAVLAASDGSEALVLAQHHRPCLILLDLMMPIMDGREFCGATAASCGVARPASRPPVRGVRVPASDDQSRLPRE